MIYTNKNNSSQGKVSRFKIIYYLAAKPFFQAFLLLANHRTKSLRRNVKTKQMAAVLI